MKGIKALLRRWIYRLKHDFFAVENVVLVLAVVLCLTWTYQSIVAMSRNWELTERLAKERRELQVVEIETEELELQNQYFGSNEYQELLARKFLDKQLPGENMVVLPTNSDEAKRKHDIQPSIVVEKQLSNFEKWLNFLFPKY